MTVLSCAGLNVRIAGIRVVDDLDLDIRPGQFWGLLGPNGIGKTTLLRCLAGLVEPADRIVELLEQTSATLDQITATVQKSAEGAENTRKIVNTAREDAESSGDVVNRALAAMLDIETAAAETDELLSAIT